MRFFKKEEPSIEFISMIPGLESIDECKPKPAKEYTPNWWKHTPNIKKEPGSVFPQIKTVKICPSFPDFFAKGYVIPAWADITIQYNELTEEWYWRVGQADPGNPFLGITPHSNEQFLNYTNASSFGIDGTFVFKLNCPWRVVTPKGISVLQLPMFYNFNKEWTILPGITDTSAVSEVNQQLLYHGNGKEIFIPRGTPLAQYIPIPTKYVTKFNVRQVSDTDSKMFNYQYVDSISQFFGGYRRRKQGSNNED